MHTYMLITIQKLRNQELKQKISIYILVYARSLDNKMKAL